MKRICYLSLVVFLVSFSKYNIQSGQPISNKAFVMAHVKLRKEASLNSEVLSELQPFSKVEIIARTEQKVSLDNVKDYWYHVQTENGTKAWVFGAYTSLKSKGQKTAVFEFMKYSLDDLEHLFFKNMEEHNEIDFGFGYNNLCGYHFEYENAELEEYTGNPKYVGQQFKITYNNLLTDLFIPSDGGENVLTPTIIKIELIQQ